MTALVQLYAPDIPPADYDCSASVVTDEGEISRCAICLEGPCAKGERSHRRDCHSADAPSPSLLNYIRREREVQQNDSLVNGQVSATQSPPDAATNSARCGTSQTWTMLRHDCPNHLGLCAPPPGLPTRLRQAPADVPALPDAARRHAAGARHPNNMDYPPKR